MATKIIKETYKYDIAISFLSQDESSAFNFYENLKEFFKIFCYSENQKEIAGKDGLVTLSNVFQKDSRLVIVLYRNDWGKTKWTRVEETAIKDRALNEGWTFLLVIALDPPNKPIWLPDTLIWFDLKTFKFDEALGIIKSRVLEVGGHIHEESAIERAKRMNYEIEQESKRKQFLNSKEGYDAANKEAFDLFKKAEKSISELSEIANIPFENKREYCYLELISHGIKLKFDWQVFLSNSSEGSCLHISLERISSLRIKQNKSKNRFIKDAKYVFEKNIDESIGWRDTSGNNQFYKSEQLIDAWFKSFIDEIKLVKQSYIKN